jgi:hypothetical protein
MLKILATADSIPLKSQHVHLDIRNQIANFTIEQCYVNDATNPIETYYTFPTPGGAAVYFFEAKTDDGTVIHCKIKEKMQAKKEYNDAINDGMTGYWMEMNNGDIFSVAVGNLAANSIITICIKYVIELNNEEDCRKLRVNIPLTIMPKYPSGLDPDTWFHTIGSGSNPPKISSRPYHVSITGNVMMMDGIRSLDSKTHTIKISDMNEKSLHFEFVDLEQLNRDIVMTIERLDSQTYAIQECMVPTTTCDPATCDPGTCDPGTCDPGTCDRSHGLLNSALKYCTALNIVPDFSKLPPPDIKKIHYVLMLDKSGSMFGPDIEICKKASKIFVAMLPAHSTFDIYQFSDTYEKFASSEHDMMSRKKEAGEWISRIQANGGTEMLPCLENIYKSFDPDKMGILIVLSDGGVSNTEQVLKLVKKHPNVSVFSIGIGANVSQDLIRGFAEHSAGHSEFIGSRDKNIIGIIRAQLKRSQESLRRFQNQYSIEYDKTGKSIMVPGNLPVLYERTNNIIYCFSENPLQRIIYREMIDDGSWIDQIIVVEPINDPELSLHRMAGIKLLGHLQHSENIAYTNKSLLPHMHVHTNINANEYKKDIIDISIDLNILSKYTAFIGVDNRADKVKGNMELKYIPLQHTDKELLWGGMTKPIGLDTISSTRKDTTRNIGKLPPKFCVSPWLQSSIEPSIAIPSRPIGLDAIAIDSTHKNTTQNIGKLSPKFCVAPWLRYSAETERRSEKLFVQVDSRDRQEPANGGLIYSRMGTAHPFTDNYMSSINDLYRALPRTVDELRSTNCPKINYGEYRATKLDKNTIDTATNWNDIPDPTKRVIVPGRCSKHKKTKVKKTKVKKMNKNATYKAAMEDQDDVLDSTDHDIKPGQCTEPRIVPIVITIKLSTQYIVLDDGILAATMNGSLSSILKIETLKPGDCVELTKEDHDINGLYEIISQGSADEPWVLQKIK